MSRKQAIRAELDAARAELNELARRLSPADWEAPSPNEGWTARDVLAHLAGGESGMLVRIKRAMAGENPSLPANFDLTYWNRRQVEKRRDCSPAELLGELAAIRQESLAILAGLDDTQLALPCGHPIKPDASIGFVFEIIARHERGHVEDIRRAVEPALSRRS